MAMVKVSLQGLADLITAGQATVTTNNNMRFVNNESTFDPTKNDKVILVGYNTAHSIKNTESTIILGTDAGYQSEGMKHTVMIGTEAGYQSKVPVGGDETDTANIFIGYRAGKTSDNNENCVFIGTSAGDNADESSDSIFIGSSAGISAKNPNSIGIGEHALRGGGVDRYGNVTVGGGTGNIEIVTGLLDNQRLMYGSNHVSYRLNIQNCIAGWTADSEGIAKNRISIGDATVEPDAPLSVRRESRVEMHQDTPYVQTWHNDDTLKSYVGASGDYILYHEPNSQFVDGASHFPPDGNPTPSWFGNYEGIVSEAGGISAATDFGSPTSGKMIIMGPDFLGAGTIWITNRDDTLTIPKDRYVITSRVNGENRPVAISCPP